jgi:tetraprenyl-beta-curcumene synthase
LGVLGEAAARELTWALLAVAREVRAWHAIAETIPTGATRDDALSSLARKRSHTDGAALFCIFPRAREPVLLRLLVAYEIMWDFLDSVNERGAERGQVNGRQLHLALVDALDPDRPVSDYYRYHPWCEDGGYLAALVRVCREACVQLSSYESVRETLTREAWRAQVLAANHDLDPTRRDEALQEWARQVWTCEHSASWYELTGAASASLTIHVPLALAATPHLCTKEITSVYHAYSPWISATTTMLDSYVDQVEDRINGDHSYVGHYPTRAVAVHRIGELLRRSTQEADCLPNGKRHTLIVASMAAMYLSKDSTQLAFMRQHTRQIARCGGSLTGLLLPILRLWRIAYAQRTT